MIICLLGSKYGHVKQKSLQIANSDPMASKGNIHFPNNKLLPNIALERYVFIKEHLYHYFHEPSFREGISALGGK